jgi:hypothetical protein
VKNIPKKLSEQELQSLIAVWAKASEAYNACFGYFNSLHEAFDARGDDWSKHIHEVIFAGKDEAYNDLKRVEDSTLKQARDFTKSMAVTYPYLSWFENYGGWYGGNEDKIVRDIVQREWKDAALTVIRAEFKEETDKFYKMILGYKQYTSLSDVADGSFVYFIRGDTPGLFKVVSKTPGGRKVTVCNAVTGKQTSMRNEGKRGYPYAFVVIPEDQVAGLTDLSKRWDAALQEAGIKGE